VKLEYLVYARRFFRTIQNIKHESCFSIQEIWLFKHFGSPTFSQVGLIFYGAPSFYIMCSQFSPPPTLCSFVPSFAPSLRQNDPHNSLKASGQSPASIALSDFRARARMAIAVAKSLSDFHDGGVAHHLLSPDNIVLDVGEGECVATIIDLSMAQVVEVVVNGTASTFDARRKDLRDLGVVLNLLFTGEDELSTSDKGHDKTVNKNETENENENENLDSSNEGDNADAKRDSMGSIERAWKEFKAQESGNSSSHSNSNSSKRACKRGGALSSQKSDRLPQYLRSVISALLLSSEDGTEGSAAASTSTSATMEPYTSARDVWLDLQTMMEKSPTFVEPSMPPQQHHGGSFEAADVGTWRPQIPSGAFYGRRIEFSLLLKSFHSVVSLGGRSAHLAMAVVTGCPGTG
jgi:hypothetical protein